MVHPEYLCHPRPRSLWGSRLVVCRIGQVLISLLLSHQQYLQRSSSVVFAVIKSFLILNPSHYYQADISNKDNSQIIVYDWPTATKQTGFMYLFELVLKRCLLIINMFFFKLSLTGLIFRIDCSMVIVKNYVLHWHI